MTVRGHVTLASALAYYPLSSLIGTYNIAELSILYIIVLFGSTVPDIDEPGSYIGRRSFFISDFLKLIGIKHRTLTHWLILPLFIFLLSFYFFNGFLQISFFALAFGILCHDIGDMITKGGINGFLFPLFPKAKIVLLPRFLRFYTSSLTEMFIILLLLALNIYLYYCFFAKIGVPYAN